MLGDIQAALGNKNPQVKEGTLKFLGRCLSTTPTPISPGDIKPVSEQLAGLMEDSFEGARNEAANCLGTLMKMVGERPLGAVMESLADVRKAKVKEAFEKATVKAKAGGGPPKAALKAAPAAKAPAKAAPKVAPKAAPPAQETPADDLDPNALMEDQPLKKPPARFLVRLRPFMFDHVLIVYRLRNLLLLLPPRPLRQRPPLPRRHHRLRQLARASLLRRLLPVNSIPSNTSIIRKMPRV
jgi:cytoskeleton-associated protein 5